MTLERNGRVYMRCPTAACLSEKSPSTPYNRKRLCCFPLYTMETPTNETTELKFRSFTARVIVDGEPIPLYQCDFNQATKTASAYIASEPGKRYKLSWRMDEDVGSDTAGYIHLDGARRSVSGAFNHQRKLGKWVERGGALLAAHEERPFIFAELKTTGEV